MISPLSVTIFAAMCGIVTLHYWRENRRLSRLVTYQRNQIRRRESEHLSELMRGLASAFTDGYESKAEDLVVKISCDCPDCREREWRVN